MKKYLIFLLVLFPLVASAQGVGTLDKWVSTTTPVSGITQRTFGNPLVISGLTTGLCLTLDSNRQLTTTTCGSGSGTVTNIATTWPILGGPITTTGTLTFGGLSTSTAAVVGNVPYFSGVNTFANSATGTITCTGSASCGTGSYVLGNNLIISSTGGGTFSWTPTTNYGALANATGTPIWFQAGLQASTTSHFYQATTSLFTVLGNIYLPSLGTGVLHNTSGGAVSSSVVTNAELQNSTISGVALGSNLNSLSHDTTLSGTSYNGSAAVSDWGIDLAHSNVWTGLQKFNGGASSTGEISAVTASSSNLIISGVPNALLSAVTDGTVSATVVNSPLSWSNGTLACPTCNTSSLSGSGAANQITYWGGTNALTGSNNFIVDAPNGHMAIGTLTPYAGLTIFGNGTGGKFFEVANSASTTIFEINSSSIASTSQFVVSNSASLNYIPQARLVGTGPAGLLSGINPQSPLAMGAGTLTCGGCAYPFTGNSNFGVPVQSTSTIVWFTQGIQASSTSQIAYASTTMVSAQTASTSALIVSGLGNGSTQCLNIDGTGIVGSQACTSGGTVTSIDVSGGTTGLTTSGGPVTTSGTITLAGKLVEANGGTNQSTYATGDMLYASAANTLSKLTVGTGGTILASLNGIPTWTSTSTLLTTLNLTKGNFLVGNDAGVAQATSSIYVSSLGLIGIGSTTPNATLSIGTNASLAETPNYPATSTAMSLGLASSTYQVISLGTSATTITFSNYQLVPGMHAEIQTCNPGSATGGAITWAAPTGYVLSASGGSAVIPGNITQAGTCDLWDWQVMATKFASTTGEIILRGTTPSIP